MATGVFRPSEIRVFHFDFGFFPEIQGGEVLSSIILQPSVAFPAGNSTPPLTLSQGAIETGQESGKLSGGVFCLGSGGQDGVEYVVTCTAQTNAGHVLSCVGYPKCSALYLDI